MGVDPVPTVQRVAIGDLEVRDAFQSPAQIAGLLDCASQRRERGEFRAARIGAKGGLQRHQSIRGDSTCWLEEPLFPAERKFLAALETLRLDFNRRAYLGLFDLEVHYAWYPPGTGYERHVDQLQGRAQRRMSLILYLNEDWCSEDGGHLRVFSDDGFRDIEPVAGRLVTFLTANREHAVLATRRDRLGLSGWFRGRD